jgi:hypothetical protein
VHDDQAGVKPSLAISVRSRALPDAASQKFLVSRFSNMSKRAAEFLEEWVGENPVRPVAGAPEGDDSEARLRAEECLSAAKEEGIAKDDIEEEVACGLYEWGDRAIGQAPGKRASHQKG